MAITSVDSADMPPPSSGDWVVGDVAHVSVGEMLFECRQDGTFRAVVWLEEGPNSIVVTVGNVGLPVSAKSDSKIVS